MSTYITWLLNILMYQKDYNGKIIELPRKIAITFDKNMLSNDELENPLEQSNQRTIVTKLLGNKYVNTDIMAVEEIFGVINYRDRKYPSIS